MADKSGNKDKIQVNPKGEDFDLTRLSIDFAGDSVFWMGPDAAFLYVNDAACRSLGYSREELLQMSVHDIDPNFPKERWADHWRDVKRDLHFTLETVHRKKDGKIFPVEVTVNYLDYKGKEYNCAFARDITSRKKAEKIQSSIFQISDAVHSARNLKELYRLIHEIITELMPAKNNFYIALYNEESDLISFPYFVDEFDQAPAPRKPGKGLTEYVLRTGRPLLASPEVFSRLEKQGEVESIGEPSIDWLGVPLKLKEKTIGALVVQSYTEGSRYSEEEKNILMFISEQVAMAIIRRKADDALQESEELFRSIVENSHHGILIIDDRLQGLYANDEFLRITGRTKEDLIGKNLMDQLEIENRDIITERYRKRQQGDAVPSRYEVRFTHPDGGKRWGEIASAVVKDSKLRVKTVMQIRDVTETKQSEERIKASLQEKEALLREIHHRVKNNLQIISSLLNLQSRHVEDLQALDKFEESRRRVKSMAIVHEKLYGSEDLSRIDFGEYLRTLAGHLMHMYSVDSSRIKMKFDIGRVFLDIHTSIPCGLLASELISNSLKHAYPGETEGEIRIRMKQEGKKSFSMNIEDDGIGLPEDFELKAADTFGFQLVDMLTEQLQGNAKIRANPGVSFSILFKELEYKKK